MATAEEQFNGVRDVFSSDNNTAEVGYDVHDAADEAAVKAIMNATAPSTRNGLFIISMEIYEQVNNTTWRVRVRYAERTWTENPDSRFSFDTTGGSQHITQSLTTVNAYGDDSSRNKDAIGFDGKNVEGVDITVPVYEFSEVHFFDDGDIDNAYKSTLRGLTGSVNNNTFKGFAAGEVLFLGAVGSRQGDDPSDQWEISYRFVSLPNQTGLSVGDIPGIAKKGWEYMDIRYSEVVETASGSEQVLKAPFAVYIHRVYPDGNFAGIGIGV